MIVEALIVLAVALPLLAALWIAIGYLGGWNRGEAGERPTVRVSISAVAISLLLMLLLDSYAVVFGLGPQVVIGEWFSSGDLTINLSFRLDSLGLVMATLVAFITLIILKFSVNYMHREPGFQRFFMILSVFSSAMLLITTAGNAILLFVGWEMAGVSSYLLIAYTFERPTSGVGATRAFITNRIGDIALILAIFLSFNWLGGIEWTAITAPQNSSNSLTGGLTVLAFLIAAFAKSAQVPFSPWLARALEGPTPSSAVFYGSLMVHAGLYLVLRLQPLIENLPWVMALLIVVGTLTAAYGFLGALVQSDVKSSLIFSTNAQVGLMFLFAGIGWFELAAWYMVAHAIWRAFQLLSAPGYMHMMNSPARPATAWLRRHPRLFIAALQRFWLDHIADWLLVRPTTELARDIHEFDERVVNRVVGLSGSSGAIISLAKHQEGRQGRGSNIGTGRGMMGRLLQWIASTLYWFEERLVLRSGGEGMLKGINILGHYIQQIDTLLSHPRYLLLIIMATFVVII